MNKAYTKDILRTIKKNAKRFVAILAITALGLTAFAGITAACRDLYLAADRFYDAQRLFDVRVLSTLGLTDEDVQALQEVSGVDTADGAYTETVHLMVDDLRQSAEMTMLSEKGLNTPYLLEGRLPEKTGEIAVTQKYLNASGQSIGGSLTIEETLDEDEPDEGSAAGEAAPDANAGAEPDAAEPSGGETGTGGTDTGNTAEGGDDAKPDDDSLDVDWDAEVEIEEEAEAPTFQNTTYTITGVVIDPMDVGNSEGSTAFRSTAATDFTFFVTPHDVDTEVYTAVYLTLNSLAGLDCYSSAYEDAVAEAIGFIESRIMNQRQQARYDSVMAEAAGKITDAEDTMNDKFAEADEQFADAWADIEEAKRELADGEAELTREERDALQKLADARAELEDGKQKLRDGEAELAEGEAELEATAAKTEKTFASQQAALDASRGQLTPGAEALAGQFGAGWPAAEWEALVAAAAAEAAKQLGANPGIDENALGAAVATATAAQQADFTTALGAVAGAAGITGDDLADLLANGVSLGLGLGTVDGSQQVLDAGRQAFNTQIAAARKKLAAGRAEIEQGWADLAAGEAELNAEEEKALRELADAWAELAEGKQELAEGEAELIENEEKYREKKSEAEEKVADAWAELDDIDMAQWYVQDRTSLDSYASLDTDLASIGAIGQAFPVLFLVVAVLISLTTMTRMVEEERGLIGTYKALGFGNLTIAWKYLVYALLASLAGGAVGCLLGFIALPKLLVVILEVIYVIPNVTLEFDAALGLAGVGLFLVSNVAATALACHTELRQTPAALMRPKAPRAGSRIFLERVSPVWNRLRFLNKVTARNLFRYKKRLFMTVIGIAGCTALVLAGFAIRDSVNGLRTLQYEDVYRYDLLVAVEPDDNDALTALLAGDAAFAGHLPVQLDNAKLFNAEGTSKSAQLVVVPSGGALEQYIYTPGAGGALIPLDESGILVTKNAAGLLEVAAGGTVALQNLQLDRYDVTVSGVVDNYLGNNVFISQRLYESLFGPMEPNAAYAHLGDSVADQPAFAEALLDENDFVLTSMSTQAQRDQFATDFAILNYVIYILVVLAAGLAFVVLFTLANTNISERLRELATIKVLGFFDREVHSYVNKETLILTFMGVLAGLPLGWLLSGLLLAVLKMPSIEFVLEIEPLSYLIAGVISFCFALMVNLITNRVLDKINMVEALKSVE